MRGPAPGNSQPSLLKRWLREPLLHFLLGGFVLFAVYGALNPQTGDRFQSNRIQLTEDELRQMAVVWAAKWQRPPTPEEMQSLVEDRVREEILYRESLALGLDQGDAIVKRRLAQKIEFLAEDTSVLRDPGAAELKVWFEQNRGWFAQPGRMSFRHVYFSLDRRGDRAQDAAAKALGKLAGQPADSPAAANAGDRFMFQEYYADRDPEQLAGVFGTKFAQALFQLKPGVWQGPVESGLGWHLVFVNSITPGRVPAFEEIEPDVKAAWINEQRADAKRRMYAAMRARYEVVLPAAVTRDAAGAAQAAKSP
jgi:parvulin-like peptidyl-prolyl isomerase